MRTKASQEKMERIEDKKFKAWVRAAPERGNANEALRDIIAHYFKVSPSAIRIVTGARTRHKIVEIR